jgi:hypothetical protein
MKQYSQIYHRLMDEGEPATALPPNAPLQQRSQDVPIEVAIAEKGETPSLRRSSKSLAARAALLVFATLRLALRRLLPLNWPRRAD